MINYEVDPPILEPYIPSGLELDLWQGKALVSLVGFIFLNTRIKGFSIPYHRDFEEVNLRFYTKRVHPDGWRRGVAFIKEIVPKTAIAFIARLLYNENYVKHPMSHNIQYHADSIHVDYQWKINGVWQKIGINCHGAPFIPPQGSEAEFITEHYWGYSKQKRNSTMEYQVKHPQWRIWTPDEMEISIDAKSNYGDAFAPFLEKSPVSAFLAEGSAITVSRGQHLRI